MKKLLALLLPVLLLVAGGGYYAYRVGLLKKVPVVSKLTAPGSPAAADAGAATPAKAAKGTAEAVAAGGLARTDLVAVEMGGRVERVTSEYNSTIWSATRLLDTSPTGWDSKDPATFPQEIVLSFFGRQQALVAAVVIDPHTTESKDRWAKDVEVWTSPESATAGFVKAGAITLRNEPGDQRLDITPVEARYVMLAVRSNYGATTYVGMGKVKVIEGERAGYASLVSRNPDLATAVGLAKSLPAVTPATLPVEASSGNECTPAATAPPPNAAHGESHNLLVVSGHNADTDYPPLAYKAEDQAHNVSSIFARAGMRRVGAGDAGAALLADSQGLDTVVISQICGIRDSVSAPFKRALMAWVARGHKLIIQDADSCGSPHQPSYDFLPYHFATSNPGASGASSDRLLFVEENSLASSLAADPAFLDIHAWLEGRDGNRNELGDSNAVTEYDPHWCGVLFGTNVKKINGFEEAYAHYGRGLIIYDGFDMDQVRSPAYRQIVGRELMQPFDPDGLPCSVRLGDFVIATEERLKRQPIVPGRTYTYPLTLLSNQAYKGHVNLSLSASPADATLGASLAPNAIDLDEIGRTTLTVTTSANTPATAHTLAIKGVDAAGKTNVLCLNLVERTTGGLNITTDLQARKPNRNLEIILDESGSMKERLGKSTRIDTARTVLKSVLGKIPDDFNVGLRLYGHRYGSRQKETCTDSELVVPVTKLDRNAILSIVGRTNPRGETPLVYSVLRTIDDLKPVGGGAVILITDGEESCGGNAVAAAKQLKDSGLDVRLDIVGFTLQGKAVQQTLTTFASATGGHFYSAQDGEALSRALLLAAIERLPYVVYDAAGTQVAKGEAGGPPEELPPGRYKVVMTAGDQQVTSDGVVISSGRDTTLKVSLTGDRFVVTK